MSVTCLGVSVAFTERRMVARSGWVEFGWVELRVAGENGGLE